MKILWISHLLPYPPKGGVMQRSYNILKELSKYNEVDFLTLYQKGHHKLIGNSVESAVENINKISNILGVFPIKSDEKKIFKLYNILMGYLTNKPYMVWWLHNKDFEKEIYQLSRKKKYDIFFFDTLGLAQYIDSIPSNAGKIILNHHNIESHLMYRRAKNENNKLKSHYFHFEGKKRNKYEISKCALCDLNLVVSDLDRDRFRDLIGNFECSVVPNGVDLEYFVSKGAQSTTKSLIFIGGLSFYPNIAAIRFVIKELWPTLKEKKPELKFYILGRNPPKDITELAKRDSSICVTGFLDDIRQFLEEATVYICPITDGGGTKLKILDALAMKKAIVAHPIACEGIDITDGEDVILANTPDEFIDRTIQLLDDHKKREMLGENARKLIQKKYSYECIGKELHATLKKLVFYGSSPD